MIADMVKLSVNVNKVATFATRAAGACRPSSTPFASAWPRAPGITVHPRADDRHITTDVRDGSPPNWRRCGGGSSSTSRAIHVRLRRHGHAVRPDQCTLVPVREGEITSQAGWSPETRSDALRTRSTAAGPWGHG